MVEAANGSQKVSTPHHLRLYASSVDLWSIIPFNNCAVLQGAGLRNTSVTLMLYWDHMPLTGTLFQHSVAVDTFECPGSYARR